MDEKSAIRKKAMSQRRNMTAEQAQRYSDDISKKLQNYLEKLNFNSIHIYISYNNEPDTLTIIKRMLATNYNIYVPVIRDNIMHSVRIFDMDFVSGKYGILEPKNFQIEPASTKYDVIIVPTLAYDDNNNRLGYGKGFYDRFLATQHEAMKIGLSYSFNKVDKLPTDKHDVKLDIVITEKFCI